MSEQIFNKNEEKAIEIIKIVDGLSQEQINNIFSIVNHSINKSSIKIEFHKKRASLYEMFSDENDENRIKEATKKFIDKSLEENVIIHT